MSKRFKPKFNVKKGDSVVIIAGDDKGGLVKKEAPIHISNVKLWDAKKSEAAKVKRTRENGKLIRVSKKSGDTI